MQKEGETCTNAYTRLRAVYGEQCMSRSRVFEWFKRFKDGRASTDNNSRSRRPATAVNDENIERVNELIRGDRRLTVKDIMTITCLASVKSPCTEITKLVWMMLSAASKRG